MPDGTVNCPRCGQGAQPGSQFCENCGAPLSMEGGVGGGQQPSVPPPDQPLPDQPPTGPNYPTSGPPGYGHRRLNPVGVGGSLAAVVMVAAVAGVVVPKIIHHSSVPNVGPAGTTTVPTTAPASTVPPSTAPATTVPPSTAPASTAPAGTAPAATVPAGQGAATGTGQTLSNAVVSVVVPAGWSESSNSSNTDLFLLGPSGLDLELFTEQLQAGTTITDVFQSELVQRQKSSPDAQVCENTTSATLPGTPAVNGYYQGVCFTLTPQNGPATPYESATFAGLVPGSSGSLLVQESVYTPRSTTSAMLRRDVVPVLRTVHWRQTSGS